MEFTNPDKKSLNEIMEIAGAGKKVVVVIGSGETGSLAEKVLRDPNMMAVRIENLKLEDQISINNQGKEKKENPFENPPIPINNYRQDIPEIKITKDDLNKKWYDNVPKRKKKKRF